MLKTVFPRQAFSPAPPILAGSKPGVAVVPGAFRRYGRVRSGYRRARENASHSVQMKTRCYEIRVNGIF